MPEHANQDWVLPASIPFTELKGKDLEECVYWLLDAMGAKDLEWRIGGTGGGAADGGRDLEASFFEANQEGELTQQKWWIECKGRSGTVEADEVKSAIVNAQAYEGVDQLIIATNTQFSNPTRDWIKEWQSKYSKPKIQLWDRPQLERYLSRHPEVVLRLFSEALSIQGRFKAMESRFWNKLDFTPPRTMADLWKQRNTLEVNAMGLFASIANEFANGSITNRPWGAVLEVEDAMETLSISLHNLPYLCYRSIRSGVEQEIIIRSIAYLVLVVLEFLTPQNAGRLVIDSLNRSETDRFDEEAQKMLLMPVINQLLSELQDVCSSDCGRVSLLSRSALSKNKDEVNSYWQRLESTTHDEEPMDQGFLTIVNQKKPCKIGFAVDACQACPLFDFEPTMGNVNDFMVIIERVAKFRKSEAALQREEDKLKAKAIQKNNS